MLASVAAGPWPLTQQWKAFERLVKSVTFPLTVHRRCSRPFRVRIHLSSYDVINTINPLELFKKFQDMSINTSQCLWILDCLRDRRQVVRFDNITSHPLTTRAEVSRGCCSFTVALLHFHQMVHTSAINLKRKLNSNINHGIQLIQLRKQVNFYPGVT